MTGGGGIVGSDAARTVEGTLLAGRRRLLPWGDGDGRVAPLSPRHFSALQIEMILHDGLR